VTPGHHLHRVGRAGLQTSYRVGSVPFSNIELINVNLFLFNDDAHVIIARVGVIETEGGDGRGKHVTEYRIVVMVIGPDTTSVQRWWRPRG